MKQLLSFEEVKEVEVERLLYIDIKRVSAGSSFSPAYHSNHVNDVNTVNYESLYLYHLRDFECHFHKSARKNVRT
jgi:hypothetical protein